MRKLIGSASILLIQVCLAGFIAGENTGAKPEIKIQQGHTKNIYAVVFSPDGKKIISCSYDRTLKLWDAVSGKLIRTLAGHTEPVLSAAFAPDGKSVLSGSYDNTLKLWDLESGKEIKTFIGHTNGVYSVAFLPGGKIVISGARDNTLKFWDVESSKEMKTFTGHSDCVVSVAISPDGKTVLSGSWDNTLKLWDKESGKEIRTFVGHSDHVRSAAFLPDGKSVISVSDMSVVKYWDIESGKEIRTDNNPTVKRVAFSPDMKTAVSSSSNDNTLTLWDIGSGKTLKTFTGPYWTDGNLALAPDNKTIICGLSDNTLTLWDISAGKNVRNFYGRSKEVEQVSCSPDGKTIIFSSNGSLKLFDASSGKNLRVFKGNDSSYGATFSPDGKMAVSRGDDVILWDVESGKVLKRFGGPKKRPYSAAFSPDQKTIITGSREGNIYVWDVENGKNIRTLKGHTNYVYSVAFSADGKTAISGSVDSTIILWNVEKGKRIKIFKGHTNGVNSVAFSPDMKTAVSGSDDHTLKLWDIESGKEIRTFAGHIEPVLSVAFSPDGKYVLSGVGYIYDQENTLKLWDKESGKEIRTFAGHAGPVSSVAFMPEGKTAVSGSADATIRLWDIASGQLIYTIITSNDGSQWVIYDEDGYWDASPNGGDLVAMVKGMEDWNIDQFAVKNNRPDKILAKLPEGSPELIQHFYNQYRKRLRKLKLTEAMLSQDNETPETRITMTKQNEKNITIDFTVTSKTAKVTRYNIFINDVPIFGAYGKEISDVVSKSITFTETIELTSGDNKIEISAMNEHGAESFRALTYTNYQPATPVKPDLYYIGFGVSNYKDSSLNLKYAHKDAKDLADVYGKMKGQYANVHVTTFVNEQCTLENIKKAKELLKNSKPDDTFVFFIAGHGIHDQDKDATYYYVTYETDIKNLSGTAANFDIIEDIMQGIPPRNKLFLMDTCESGEMEDNVQADYLAMADTKGINSRGLKIKKVDLIKKEVKRPYLFDKDRYIYNDLARRSGAIVFSSCKGGEFSYESEAVGNGFFTSEIINALKGDAKTDNGAVSVDSLKDYVIKEVSKLADGKQNPTVDRDNIYQKFSFPVMKQ